MDSSKSSSAQEMLADSGTEAEERVMVFSVPICSPIFESPVKAFQQFPYSCFPGQVVVSLTRPHTRHVVNGIGCPIQQVLGVDSGRNRCSVSRGKRWRSPGTGRRQVLFAFLGRCFRNQTGHRRVWPTRNRNRVTNGKPN